MQTELELQQECTIWFQNTMRNHRGRFRRVKNETDLKGKFGARMGALNKSTGIVKGTWDAFLIVNPIAWIEFKVGSGVLSADQKDFARMGAELGWAFYIVRSLDDFKKVIYGYYDQSLDGQK